MGQVSSIGVQHGHALVALSINNTVTLHRATDVGMRWHNVIGQKEIELFPGHGGPVLAPGATIPLTHDVTDASIDTFLNSLGPVLSSINPKQANEFVENVSGALEGDTAEINQLINSGATVSSTVQALDSQVGQIIGNLNQVLTALASRSGDIDSLVTNLQTVSSALASKNSLLDDVVGNLSLVATDLAGLIGNNHNTITSTIDSLQTVAADVQNNQQNLATSLSSLGRRTGAVHPDLPMGTVVRRRDRLHLPGRSVCLPLLPTRHAAGRLRTRWEPALAGPALRRHDARSAGQRDQLFECADRCRVRDRLEPAGGLESGSGPAGCQRSHHGRVAVKAFTERNPKIVGITAVIVMAAGVLAILFLNRSLFSSGYTVDARFTNAAGIAKGTEVMEAGVNVGSVSSVEVHGNAVDAHLSVNRSVVLPHKTTAAVEVETLLGVVDVTLKPVSGWNDPLKPGTLITDTTVPTEFYQLQNKAHSLLSKSNARALNSLVTSLADITKDKQTQVAQIISGLGALTTTVDQRSGQVSQLIDSANTLSSTLAGRDQQLLSIVNNLNTVSTGLAAHNQDLSNLITNVDSMASQTNSLVSQDSPALNALLKSLHSDLTVVGQHQEDLAEGVSYLGGALKGFQSIAYSGSSPVPWGNIFVNPASLTNTFGVIGPCGAFDEVLNQVLGPDPASCNDQTGPLPGEGAGTGSGSGSSPSTGSSSSSAAPSSPSTTSGSSGSSPAGGAARPGRTRGSGGLSQLISPLLQGIG